MPRTGWLLGCMVLLAGLDLTGALLAQQYSERHLPLALVLGVMTFVVLFLVYAFSLEFAQLSIVTMGWIVLLQVGLIGVDLTRARLHLDRSQALAVLAILALQCYLVVSTQSTQSLTATPVRRQTEAPAIPCLGLGIDRVADGPAPPPGAV